MHKSSCKHFGLTEYDALEHAGNGTRLAVVMGLDLSRKVMGVGVKSAKRLTGTIQRLVSTLEVACSMYSSMNQVCHPCSVRHPLIPFADKVRRRETLNP